MDTAIIALLCHLVPVGPASEAKTVEACHQELVWKGDEGPGVCNFAQAIIAQWKGRGKYAADEWTVNRYGCTPGGKPFLKDAT
jgi:hypothetical protein